MEAEVTVQKTAEDSEYRPRIEISKTKLAR